MLTCARAEQPSRRPCCSFSVFLLSFPVEFTAVDTPHGCCEPTAQCLLPCFCALRLCEGASEVLCAGVCLFWVEAWEETNVKKKKQRVVRDSRRTAAFLLCISVWVSDVHDFDRIRSICTQGGRGRGRLSKLRCFWLFMPVDLVLLLR